jgi:hypothetical protein
MSETIYNFPEFTQEEKDNLELGMMAHTCNPIYLEYT